MGLSGCRHRIDEQGACRNHRVKLRHRRIEVAPVASATLRERRNGKTSSSHRDLRGKRHRRIATKRIKELQARCAKFYANQSLHHEMPRTGKGNQGKIAQVHTREHRQSTQVLPDEQAYEEQLYTMGPLFCIQCEAQAIRQGACGYALLHHREVLLLQRRKKQAALLCASSWNGKNRIRLERP